MQLDSRCIMQLVDELDFLLGSRVDRIGQPQDNEVHMSLRQARTMHRFCISLRKDMPRAHLTTAHPDNLKRAPALCMALRRHLEGARLVAAHAPKWERYFILTFSARNRLGDPVKLDLIVELIPRASNLTLVDAGGRVLNGSKHRPGSLFSFPPEQAGVNPEELEQQHLASTGDEPAWKSLMSTLRGFGPLLAKEAVHRAGLPLNLPLGAAWPHMEDLVQSVHAVAHAPAEPAVYRNQEGQVLLWHAITLDHLHDYPREPANGAHQAAEMFYSHYLAQQTLVNRRRRMRQVIQGEMKRTAKKLSRQTADLQRAENADDYKLWGELLYAQSPQGAPGARQVQVMNYYTNESLTIPLDPTLSVKDNARKFFDKYNKALRTKKKAQRAVNKTQSTLDYLYSLSDSLERANGVDEVQDIWAEMQRENLVRRDGTLPAGGKKRPAFNGLTFASPQGHTILLGKNHRQNEELVRLARPDDIWLHARGVPGAHVLVRTPSAPEPSWPDEATLLMAAQLAAHHSKAAQTQHVDVDWTWAKHVRKPKRGRPGMVFYDHEQTVRVTPEAYAPTQSPE